MNLKHQSKIIWTIENFLSEKECEDLILNSEQRPYESAGMSMAIGEKMLKVARNNYYQPYHSEKLAREYWQRLKPFCPEKIEENTAVGLYEAFRFYKYESNQRFKRHLDGRVQRGENEESRITFLVYLNDDFEGGETQFDDVTIHPKKGMALCFIHEQKHEGRPVPVGTKYVLRSDIMYKKIIG